MGETHIIIHANEESTAISCDGENVCVGACILHVAEKHPSNVVKLRTHKHTPSHITTVSFKLH